MIEWQRRSDDAVCSDGTPSAVYLKTLMRRASASSASLKLMSTFTVCSADEQGISVKFAFGTTMFAIAAYAALAAYGAIVLTFNYSEFILWHHVTETLYPPLGAAWGLEHVAGGASAWFVFRLFSEAPSVFRDETFFLRGRRLISYQEAFALALRKFKVPANYLWWGMVPLRVQEAVKNFLVVGTPGSGKTVAIQLLVKSFVPLMGRGARIRMLFYDAKSEIWPILAAMNPRCRVRTLNLEDGRVDAWDIAKDVRTRRHAREAAAFLVPEDLEKDSPFFLNSTRLVFQAVIEVLILAKNDTWTLRDLVLALWSIKRVEAVISSRRETRHVLANLAEPRTRNNVIATVQNARERLSYTAAVWHRIWPDKSRRISLSEWIHGDSILLLGQATAEGSPNRPLNQLLIQRLAELLDKEPARKDDQTWVILDELTDLEYVRRLDLLLRKGRSRGVACVLGFQTWSGMVRAFKEPLASEITALCGYKSFLPVNDPPTAKWAADHFGDQELLEYRVTRSESTSHDGKTSTSRSRSPQQVIRPSVMPAELLANEATDEETGFKGFHLSPQVKDGYKTHTPWDWVIGKLRSSDGGSESQPTPPALNPWSIEEEQEFQYLPDWSDEECKALGLPPVREMDGGEPEAAAKSAADKIKNISRENLNQ